MPQAELARRMGKSAKAVNELLTGAKVVEITPSTALQLEQALGTPASYWLNRESAYRESAARLQEAEVLSRDLEWLKSLPMTELRKRGFVTSPRNGTEAVKEALAFFGYATVKGWRDAWSQSAIHYRKSGTFSAEVGHLAAWLRCGELTASQLTCGEYSAEEFESALADIPALSLESTEVIEQQLVSRFAQAGVALALVPEFPKTHASGATHWIRGGRTPLIQLSLRHRTDDHFWFTLSHEACHVLRHARRGVFLDDKPSDGDREEEEANRFARDLLIPEATWSRWHSANPRFDERHVREFAHSVGVAPGIVVGRLQHEGKLSYKFGNSMKRRFHLVGPHIVEKHG